MNWIKTKWWIRAIFPKYIWKIPNSENKIYLTFDDGPIPEITEWVLDILKEEHIKATFFCIGDNVKKHPDIFNRIIIEGHFIGNHTFNHLNGWKTKTETYLENFYLCENIMDAGCLMSEVQPQNSTTNSLHPSPITLQPKLFRPPYGKIKTSQSKAIREKGYKLIMWDVLSYDFDKTISPEQCLENVLKNTESGSIIVFHDSIKAETNLKYALPKAIVSLKTKGFTFDVIN